MHNNVTAAKRIIDSVSVIVLKWLLQVKQSDPFSLHYVSNNMCWYIVLPINTLAANREELCDKHRARPACTPLQSDQYLHCRSLKFNVSSRFSFNSVLRVKD